MFYSFFNQMPTWNICRCALTLFPLHFLSAWLHLHIQLATTGNSSSPPEVRINRPGSKDATARGRVPLCKRSGNTRKRGKRSSDLKAEWSVNLEIPKSVRLCEREGGKRGACERADLAVLLSTLTAPLKLEWIRQWANRRRWSSRLLFIAAFEFVVVLRLPINVRARVRAFICPDRTAQTRAHAQVARVRTTFRNAPAGTYIQAVMLTNTQWTQLGLHWPGLKSQTDVVRMITRKTFFF